MSVRAHRSFLPRSKKKIVGRASRLAGKRTDTCECTRTFDSAQQKLFQFLVKRIVTAEEDSICVNNFRTKLKLSLKYAEASLEFPLLLRFLIRLQEAAARLRRFVASGQIFRAIGRRSRKIVRLLPQTLAWQKCMFQAGPHQFF